MKKNKRNWIIGIILSITATFAAVQTVSAPHQEDSTLIPNVENLITESFTSAAYEGCAFSWAYYDDPELTKKINDEIKEINSQAIVTATLFGEDCIYADSTRIFHAIETDFIVRLSVENLSKHEEFGNWVNAVMKIITKLQFEETESKYGFVEFWFEKSEVENIIFRVPIQKYLDEAKDKTGIELFNYFYQP